MATFTQQHFVAVAQILRELPIEEEARDIVIAKFAGLFAQSNPRFDTLRFQHASLPVARTSR